MNAGLTALGRAAVIDGPLAIMRTTSAVTRVATVDGRTFEDLPELLVAAGGDVNRIEPGDPVSITDADLLTPVARPRKIICIGQNYRSHVAETGRPGAPAHPDLFPKWDNSLSGPYDEIPLPPESSAFDFESELAVVIGRRARRVAPEDVADIVFGYTAANDGSVRDFQVHTSQRTAGKAWDALTPVGPMVVPQKLLGGAEPDLRVTGSLNDELMQDDRTSSMIYSVRDLVTYISTIMTLEPGDLILTGTPAGVGFVREPRIALRPGDVFDVTIEGIGTIRNRYRHEDVG